MTRKPALFLAFFAACLGGAYLYFGGVETPSIPANYAKARDFLDAAKSVAWLPWWSPMFLQGTSLAADWSFIASNAVIWAFSVPLGFLLGPKLAMIAVIMLGATGVLLFLWKLTGDRVCAYSGSVLFLLCPSLLTRAAGPEQFSAVFSMALLPWTFLAILTFFRNPSQRSALLAAMAFAAVSLASGLTGLLALPVVLLYSALEYFDQPREARPPLRLMLRSASAYLLLAVVPNLPSIRERGFLTLFDLAPFAAWQVAFSTKSALGWIDRGGWLTQAIDGAYAPTTANGGTYLGLGLFLLFVASLYLGTLHNSPEGRKARRFLALALLTFWLSFGPKGVLGGHMLFLSLSLHTPDFTPALGWFLLAAQVWIIFQIIPPEWPARRVLASIVSLIYLAVPGFRLLEWLPIYKNIRAPFDFFQLTGTLCVVIAAAILARLFFSRMRSGVLRSGITATVTCLLLLDVAPYAVRFFQESLEPRVFQDFLAAQKHLKESPVPGRVYAFSGRYFYLLTPGFSGRPIIAEAFQSHLQQRGAAILQSSAFTTDETLVSYLNISGVSHVLLDKNDPDTPPDLQERFRKLLPVDFENGSFVVLVNDKSLGAGFLAQDFIQATDSLPQSSTAAFGGARFNMATIESPVFSETEPGLRGHVLDGRIEALKSGEPMVEGRPFSTVGLSGAGTYQSVSFAPAGNSGWLVMNQAWHPDWKAFQGEKESRIHRAFLAFSAVKTDGKQPVEFRFQQPWWYNFCAGLGVLSWVVALGMILVSGSRPMSRSVI
ncbi:MAG: hypothetical protein ACOYM3_14330 [Terrimicrobiaceae bacterium]